MSEPRRIQISYICLMVVIASLIRTVTTDPASSVLEATSGEHRPVLHPTNEESIVSLIILNYKAIS